MQIVDEANGLVNSTIFIHASRDGQPSKELEGLRQVDIAPTVLQHLGIPITDHYGVRSFNWFSHKAKGLHHHPHVKNAQHLYQPCHQKTPAPKQYYDLLLICPEPLFPPPELTAAIN